ncbi:RNA-directed DNA polymerase from mobile element jockey [Eumeta japonica]|uniref:RNA-directed DNA polymerase from mobile element jockey n=1 Tax=Eumeta variegata TaxID=151549 RepID=A0A4C2AFK5_EUMVA|nr:RNA-directed DNA polymerase from mobile element jockey [Eumeta japonica]
MFSHVVTHRPSTIDIALTKELHLISIVRQYTVSRLTTGRIPNDIASTDEIDFAIGALTNHVRTVVEESEREVPASSDRRKFPPDILELIRAKTQLCAASAYPTPEYRSRARSSNEVKARVRESEMRVGATSWRKLNHPTKRFGQLPKRFKTGIYPYTPTQKPDNSVAIDDAEIAECLADSIETQCSHASLRTTSLISVASRKRFSKTSLEPKDDLAPVSLSEVQTLVKSLNTRKAPGLDGISNKAIKCFSIPLLSLLVAIFNACIKLLFSSCLGGGGYRHPQAREPRDLPASYRPISLLSGLGKFSRKSQNSP